MSTFLIIGLENVDLDRHLAAQVPRVVAEKDDDQTNVSHHQNVDDHLQAQVLREVGRDQNVKMKMTLRFTKRRIVYKRNVIIVRKTIQILIVNQTEIDVIIVVDHHQGAVIGHPDVVRGIDHPDSKEIGEFFKLNIN